MRMLSVELSDELHLAVRHRAVDEDRPAGLGGVPGASP